MAVERTIIVENASTAATGLKDPMFMLSQSGSGLFLHIVGPGRSVPGDLDDHLLLSRSGKMHNVGRLSVETAGRESFQFFLIERLAIAYEPCPRDDRCDAI